jgi:hypothetical protein
MDNLESRIRALEASNRRQRYSITALAAVIVGGTLVVAMRPAGDATFDRVTCKNLSVVDDNGKQRIGTFTSADGSAGMTWYDMDGKVRILAATRANGEAGIGWSDTNGKLRMGASTSAAGVADMTWYDKDGEQRIDAGTSANGDADILWTDKDGKLRMSAGINADSAGMVCFDRNEKARIAALTKNDGDTILPTLDLRR